MTVFYLQLHRPSQGFSWRFKLLANSALRYLYLSLKQNNPHNTLALPAFCKDERNCTQHCPYLEKDWGEWEPCNCNRNRRLKLCIVPDLEGAPNFTNPACTDPATDFKDCQEPGCYSDWSEWTSCQCGDSRSTRWVCARSPTFKPSARRPSLECIPVYRRISSSLSAWMSVVHYILVWHSNLFSSCKTLPF